MHVNFILLVALFASLIHGGGLAGAIERILIADLSIYTREASRLGMLPGTDIIAASCLTKGMITCTVNDIVKGINIRKKGRPWTDFATPQEAYSLRSDQLAEKIPEIERHLFYPGKVIKGLATSSAGFNTMIEKMREITVKTNLNAPISMQVRPMLRVKQGLQNIIALREEALERVRLEYLRDPEKGGHLPGVKFVEKLRSVTYGIGKKEFPAYDREATLADPANKNIADLKAKLIGWEAEYETQKHVINHNLPLQAYGAFLKVVDPKMACDKI